jgi:hypothetical protein
MHPERGGSGEILMSRPSPYSRWSEGSMGPRKKTLPRRVATRWRHGSKKKAAPLGRLLENIMFSEACLVAGIGF